MALAYDIILTYSDEGGDTATTTVSVPTGFTISDYLAFANDVVVALNPITSGGLRAVTLAIKADISAFTGLISTVPNTLSDIEEKGIWQFLTDLGTFKKMSIPTIDETFVTAGGDVDTGATEVVTFNTLMTGGNGTIVPTDSREEPISGVGSAYQYFRKSGRRR